tara:strand:+ start:175 stop:627 length:453 start_codon:yes stop_codon:yes gene_type:complete
MKGLTPSLTERYREVFELRCAGLSFDEIAKRTGYAGRQGAKKAYDSACKRWAVETVEQQRIVQSERLDRIFTQAYLLARNGDMQAIDRCLKIEKRRAELWGLDAPKQHSLTGADGKPLEITTDIGKILEERINAIAERDPTVIEANELEE